mmetsp:Transcript_7718/g.22547  ORF Transcript_7718/g.22547 Transcript_7718/m.22547 type:complete len:246 (-) Transcript_7718:518-1255(-)
MSTASCESMNSHTPSDAITSSCGPSAAMFAAGSMSTSFTSGLAITPLPPTRWSPMERAMARPGSVMFASSHTRAGPPHSYRSPTRGSSREPGHALSPRPPLCPLLLWRRDETARLFDPLLLGGRVRLLVFGQRDRLQLAALLDGHHLLTLEVPCRDAVLGDAPPEGGTAAAARESPTFATQTFPRPPCVQRASATTAVVPDSSASMEESVCSSVSMAIKTCSRAVFGSEARRGCCSSLACMPCIA